MLGADRRRYREPLRCVALSNQRPFELGDGAQHLQGDAVDGSRSLRKCALDSAIGWEIFLQMYKVYANGRL